MDRTGTAGQPALIWPFLAWAVVGAGLCFAVLSGFTVGIFVIPVAIAAMIALLRWAQARTIAAVGVISGPGLVLMYVAYLNRAGPGNVCSATATSQTCVTEMSPWPWLIAGIAVLAIGVTVFAQLRRPANR
jgi:hypothetical protein